MIKQKNNVLQYKLLKEEYDEVLNDIMASGYDTNGPYTEKVQETMKKITGRKHVLMSIGGTSAIEASVIALDLFDKKTAVGSYNYSACVKPFKAQSNPVFVDCDENFLIDVDRIPEDCDAVMLVNYFGNVIDYDKVASNFKGKVIADCSQSFGALYKNKFDGYYGDVSIFAFGGQKPIGTRGFAGAVATDDDVLAENLECILNQGRSKENKNLPYKIMGLRGTPQELQMGLIHVGMKYFEQWQARRKQMAEYIMSGIQNLPLRIIKANEHCDSSYYKLVVEIHDRDKFIAHMRACGVDAQVTYIDDWNTIWGTGETMPMTTRLARTTASLPLSPNFTDAEIDKIRDSVRQFYR